MLFVMTTKLTEEPVFRRCRKAQFKGDYNGMRRCYVLMLMFCKSAEGYTFRDAEDVSNLLNDTLKQCQIVWDICVDEGVFTKKDTGYTANPWLEQRRMTV